MQHRQEFTFLRNMRFNLKPLYFYETGNIAFVLVLKKSYFKLENKDEANFKN